MHPDDDSQTTLSKWPFILGDILLVATALAIAILGGWQLTNWQVGACVAAVALGAALFVLPYIVEYQVRIREEQEDRSADLRILEKHILSAEQMLDVLDARTRSLEDAAASADQPNAALAQLMDQKLAQLEVARSAQEKLIKELQKSLDELAAKEPPPGFDPAVLTPLEKRLKALESKPAPVAEVPVAPKNEAPPPKSKPEPEAAEEKPEPMPEPEAADAGPEKKEAPKPQKQVSQIERPKREARERHGPEESRLLNRAISEKGDKSSAAVSRIIESKSREKVAISESSREESKPEPGQEKKEAAPKSPEPDAKEEPKEEPKKEANAEPAPKADAEELEPEQLDSGDGADKPEAEKASAPVENKKPKPESEQEKPKPGQEPKAGKATEPDKEPDTEEPDPEEEPEPAEKPKPENKSESVKAADAGEPNPGAADPGMLFDDEKITSPIMKTKAKKNDAVITASVFIGIGNKPYLRGSAGGLNWDQGVVMEFQEIGKWRWVAPSDLEAPIDVQIFRNDEDPDKSGKYKLAPGQKLEVTPLF